MGVTGLWTLLEPISKPVPLETLENKVLAVDVSIWLHQATKGFRDAQGNPLPNAHLLGLCHRLCKLLFYRIKPVFVFDGGVPQLKRQTMAARQGRKTIAQRNSEKAAEKILQNYIKLELINQALNKSSTTVPKIKKKTEKDLFELPPLPLDSVQNTESSESDLDSDMEDDISAHVGGNIHTVDFTSESFRSLPPETQHEILLELKETRKQNSWNRVHEMPKEAQDFSGFQMQRLLKRRTLQQRLDEVSKEINRSTHEVFDSSGGSQTAVSRRIDSDSSTHYVLIKNSSSANSNSSSQQPDTSIERPRSPEKIVELSDEEFSQRELFAMIPNKRKVIELSDTEESNVEVVKKKSPILSVSVSNDLVYQESEDIFADIFCKQPPQTSLIPEIAQVEMMSSSDTESESSGGKLTEPEESPFIRPEETSVDEITVQDIGSSEEQPTTVDTITEIQVGGCLDINAPVEMVNEMYSERTLEETSNSPLLSGDEPSEDKTDEKDEISLQSSEAENYAAVVQPAEEKDEISLQSSEAETFTAVAQPTELPICDRKEDLTDTNSFNIVEKANGPISQVASPEMSRPTREELEMISNRIDQEQPLLIQQHGREQRLAASITDQMYIEAQELLRLFGIPYLVAPMEAEAQCAFLDQVGLTDGTITDDSDIWLFGGRRVYKNFFNQGKYVEYFQAEEIQRVFKMKREQLITLALLTGSDYTEGIETVGPVTAMEILAEFPCRNESLLDGLECFREWLEEVQAKKNAPPENKIRQKIRHLKLIPGFPSRNVAEAYLRPEVNESRAQFTWSKPELDRLKDYLHDKVGWNSDKFKTIVVPVLEKFASREAQTRIDSYFSTIRLPDKSSIFMSKRVLNAIRKADFQSDEFPKEPETSQDVAGPSDRYAEGSKTGRKRPKPRTASRDPKVSAVAATSPAGGGGKEAEVIWQREKDRQILEANKARAVELFKKKTAARGRSKRGESLRRIVRSKAELSDSDSD